MNREKQEKWKSFLLAFTLTITLLSAVMIATVLAVQPSMPPPAAGRPQADTMSMRPQAQDSLTLVLIRKDAADAQDFLLARFNPQYGQMPMTLLPPEALVRLDGGSLTLAQAYEQGGGRLVKAALSERFGIVVDRYAVLDRDSFIRLADKVGNVTFELPYDITYQREGYTINLAAGRRRLDGRDLADIFAYPAFAGDPDGKSALCGTLAADAVNQHLDALAEGVSSAIFTLAVNLADTDVSFADYEYRRKAADFLSKLDATVAGNLPAQGGYLPDGVSFELSEDYVALVRQYFQAVS